MSDNGLLPGMVVKSKKSSYTICKLLGEGGFGEVFKVLDIINRKFAMKVEARKEENKSKLNNEIFILTEMSNFGHFPKLFDCGINDRFYFMIIELLGPNLADLKKKQISRFFEITCLINIAQQSLEACEALHRKGFIHRDIKPANLAAAKKNKVTYYYMVDFGISRQFLTASGSRKPQRDLRPFKGTIKFASIAAHRGIDLSPKDDLECWYYTMVDLGTDGLPWDHQNDKKSVLQMKQDYVNKAPNMISSNYTRIPIFDEIIQSISVLTFEDSVDYKYIEGVLREASQNTHMPAELAESMEEAWNHKPEKRPNAEKLREKLEEMKGALDAGTPQKFDKTDRSTVKDE